MGDTKPSVLHRLFDWAQKKPDEIAQRYKSNGVWKAITASEFAENVMALTRALEEWGFTSEDVGTIFSYNRPAWVVADLAPGLLGGKSAGIYPNSAQKDIYYVLEHTRSRFFFVQNREYFEKLRGPLPDFVERVIVFEGETSFHPKAVSYAEVIESGRRSMGSAPMEIFERALEKLDLHNGTFLVYTSGTTGKPKGVMISHENLAYASDLVIAHWGIVQASMFSFLPLCHIAEKIQNLGVGLTLNCGVNYCTSIDVFAQEVAEVQPRLLLCVPRVWEKMSEAVQAKVSQAPAGKQKLVAWAFALGRKRAAAKFGKGPLSLADRVQLVLAEKLVLAKLRRALGLSQGSLFAAGAAHLAPHVFDWFHAIGVEILDNYGQSESTAILTQTVPGVDCSGTVGRPIPGTEFRLAEDGEIQTRGKHVFKGYFRDEEATRATVDSEGWLQTGDLGKRERGELIRIIGRKKEIMKTSGGKMVAPVAIEERIKESPWIGQACLVGDGRKYFCVLLTLSDDKRAALLNSGETTNGSDWVTDQEVLAKVQSEIDRVNQQLSGFEQVKYFRLLARDFSIADGEMTPTMKIKRAAIESRFKAQIDDMYQGS